MHVIAKNMNNILKEKSPVISSLLSNFGKEIFMPKGIISQSAEAKLHAYESDATIGIAKEDGGPMYLPSINKFFNGLTPSEIFPYATPFGLPELRKLWQKKIISENDLKNKNISLPVVTHAITNGLMLVGDLFINEGDDIFIPDKMWGNYKLIYSVRYKANIINYDLFNNSLKGFNIESLRGALKNYNKDKVILLFNFPNNPTGYTPTEEEEDSIKEIILELASSGKKILIVVDDAYHGLSFEDNLLKGSIFKKFVGLHPNIVAIKLDGFTKEFYVWGFRIGFLTFGDYEQNEEAYEVMEKKTAAAIRCSISNCSHPAQSICLKVLREGTYEKEQEQKFKELKTRAKRVKEIVHDKKYKKLWDVYPFNSGYFMCLKLKDIDSNKVREHALKEYGIGSISIGNCDLRIAFSSVKTEKLDKLFELIAQSIKDLRS